MEYSNSLANLKFLTRQRNIALGVAGLMLMSNVLLALGMWAMRKETIMVPGIEQEYRVAGGKVSASYLEESASMMLSHLLDLTPETVMLKKEYVIRHTAASGIREINSYFTEAQKQHQTYKFSTLYTPKSYEINLSKMEVKASGVLTSRYGKEGYKDEELEYLLKFEIKGASIFGELQASRKDGKLRTRKVMAKKTMIRIGEDK